MIQIESIHKEYPDKILFKNVTFKLTDGMRVGVVGPNGAGKTTLLKIMLGVENVDSGTVHIGKSVSIGYLQQEIVVGSEKSILEEVLSSFPEVSTLEKKIHDITVALLDSPSDKLLLKKLSLLQEEFERLNGWELENKAKKILGGLGFSEEQSFQPFQSFSGGWRMRVQLAGILLKNPNYLFLDEPTNHLDLEATIWLEKFLSKWRGGLVMISHDRQFLDASVNNILELEQGNAKLYSGNYQKYLNDKKELIVLQEAMAKNQQKKIAQTEEFIDRFRYKSSKAKQVQSRVKQLEKMDVIEAPTYKTGNMTLNIPQPERGPLKVVELKSIAKQFGDNIVFKNINLLVERGDKIGLVGINGAGKTTLLKMLAQVEKQTAGDLNFGPNILVHYFAQHQLEILDADSTVYEIIASESGSWTETQIRSYLGSFLFSGDSITKLVKVLSGGEKSRLALARLLITPAHLLLLDEPTNHLDMQSRDVIENALKNYQGSLVCISHDRHFMNEVTNKTIEVKNKNIKLYLGNYDYYKWKTEEAEQNIASEKTETIIDKKKNVDYKKKKKITNRQTKIKQRLIQIELEIEECHNQKNDPNHFSNFELLQSISESESQLEQEYFDLLEEQEENSKILTCK
jgi:ATP-binding cassette subfamily F protein 3